MTGWHYPELPKCIMRGHSMYYCSITKQLIWIQHLSDIILMRSKWGMRPRSHCCCHRLHLTPKTPRLDRVAVWTYQRQWRETQHLCCEKASGRECERASTVCREAGRESHLHFKCRGCFPLDVYGTWLLGLSNCKRIWHQRAAQRKQNNNKPLFTVEENRIQHLLRIMQQLQLITCNQEPLNDLLKPQGRSGTVLTSGTTGGLCLKGEWSVAERVYQMVWW